MYNAFKKYKNKICKLICDYSLILHYHYGNNKTNKKQVFYPLKWTKIAMITEMSPFLLHLITDF